MTNRTVTITMTEETLELIVAAFDSETDSITPFILALGERVEEIELPEDEETVSIKVRIDGEETEHTFDI